MLADAVVTGFTKSPGLLEQSLAPLRTLRREGHLRAIHYVTWDTPDIDACVAPVEAMDGVALTRVTPPAVSGSAAERSVRYQIHNLTAALALVPEPDALVLKSRPDFVADTDFLRRKLCDFEWSCAVPGRRHAFGTLMPAPVFANKIWVPWADSNQPFFCEDAAFLGRKRDLAKLNAPLTSVDVDILADPQCGHYCHIVRFAKPFLDAYPLFARYLENFRAITSDMDYRIGLVPQMLDDGFFWFLVVAHAWILHSQFHVDCGEQGDLRFYSNQANKTTDWSDSAKWMLATPYDELRSWRQELKPDSASHNVGRVFGRLMDDLWQDRLVAGTQADMPHDMLASLLENIAASGDGRLDEIEDDFYQRIWRFRAAYLNDTKKVRVSKT
jgi:hypothetical protein